MHLVVGIDALLRCRVLIHIVTSVLPQPVRNLQTRQRQKGCIENLASCAQSANNKANEVACLEPVRNPPAREAGAATRNGAARARQQVTVPQQ